MIPKASRKLSEAEFFLAHMREQESQVRLDREDFDFYLSAFLSAARSITWVLEAEFIQAGQSRRQKNQRRSRFAKWFSNWKSALADNHRELWDFMDVQRGKEVHVRGAETRNEIEYVPVTKIKSSDRSPPAYGIHWWDSPGAPSPAIGLRVHYFEIDGSPKQVVETCKDYLELLENLLADFRSAFTEEYLPES